MERWEELTEALARLQAEERALREAIFAGTFPNPKEGMNTYTLPDGRKVKGQYRINRKVEQTKAASLPTKIRNKFFRTKYELNKTAFNDGDEEELSVVYEVLTETPGLPGLDIVYPK
jgi:hypothetical protein